ncbi:MAG TPA: DUF6263 family protein [Mucilaginibacter sp.]|nr:DUF6263 family protein [Mucilaginibacter sp.]
MKKTLTLLLVAGISVTCYAQKTQLRLNLQKDSTYYLTTKTNMRITETIQGQDMVINTTIGAKMSHKVTALTDTSYELSVAMESIMMHTDEGRQQTPDVNTDDTSKHDLFSKIMSSMLHRPIIVEVTKRGHVLDVKNSDNLYAGIYQLFPEISEDKKEQIKAVLKKSFGDKSFKMGFQDAFTALPGTPVSINDKWTSMSIFETMVSARINTTYSLVNIVNNVCTIHGDATVQPLINNGGYVAFNNIPMRFNNVTGSVVSDYKMDKTTGWIREAKLIKNIKMDADIKDSPQVPGGMIMPMSVYADIEINGQ